MVTLQGRIFKKERISGTTNQKFTVYTIKTVKGYYNVFFDKEVSVKDIDMPGFVELTVTGAKTKITTSDDGRTFENINVFVSGIKQLDSVPELEALEQAELLDTLSM